MRNLERAHSFVYDEKFWSNDERRRKGRKMSKFLVLMRISRLEREKLMRISRFESQYKRVPWYHYGIQQQLRITVSFSIICPQNLADFQAHPVHQTLARIVLTIRIYFFWSVRIRILCLTKWYRLHSIRLGIHWDMTKNQKKNRLLTRKKKDFWLYLGDFWILWNLTWTVLLSIKF